MFLLNYLFALGIINLYVHTKIRNILHPSFAPSANICRSSQSPMKCSRSLIYVNNTFNSYFIIFVYIRQSQCSMLYSIFRYYNNTITDRLCFTCLMYAVLHGYLIYILCLLCNKHISITSVACLLYNVCMHIASNCFIYSVVSLILCFLIPLTLLHHIK